MKNPTRTNEEWLALVKRQQSSGLPAKTWCEMNDVNLYTMTDAAYRLRKLGLLKPQQNHTNERWLELVSRQRASGLTLEVWCKENNVKLPTMADRITRLRKAGLITEPKPNKGGKPRKGERRTTTDLTKCEQLQPTQWVEAVLMPATATETKDICVKIGKFEILVPPTFDDSAFVRVCKALASI